MSRSRYLADEDASIIVTTGTTVLPKSKKDQLSHMLNRLSEDRPSTKPLAPVSSIASKIIQASKHRDAEIQTAVTIDYDLNVEFITRNEINAIQHDREELEGLVQQSIASAMKMKEKVGQTTLDFDVIRFMFDDDHVFTVGIDLSRKHRTQASPGCCSGRES